MSSDPPPTTHPSPKRYPAPTVRARLTAAAARLQAASAPSAPRDARILLGWAAGWSAAKVATAEADPAATLPAEADARFEAALTAREQRQPVSQIIGSREFFGRRFIVTPDVLDPRPESETLVAEALATIAPDASARIVDLGVGSGCLLLSLLAERPRATGVGVDISAAALEVARRNAEALSLADRVRFQVGDWAASLFERFDAVLCNPPYIAAAEIGALDPEVREWEPRGALTPGEDGLAVYRLLAPALSDVLAPGGAALFEVGHGQADAVASLLRAAGGQVQIVKDLGGTPRVVRSAFP